MHVFNRVGLPAVIARLAEGIADSSGELGEVGECSHGLLNFGSVEIRDVELRWKWIGVKLSNVYAKSDFAEVGGILDFKHTVFVAIRDLIQYFFNVAGTEVVCLGTDLV